MKSTYEIFWSSEALRNLESIFSYLEQNWTSRELKRFAKLLDKQINIIESKPFLFEKTREVKKC